MNATQDTSTATRDAPARATTDHDRDWLDQYLTVVRRIEAPMVRTTARVATLVADYVPERPAFLARMPKVHDVMATGITARKRMVDEQTRFARQMVKALDPMLERVDTVHVDAATPTTARPTTARTTTARTTTARTTTATATRRTRPARRSEQQPAAHRAATEPAHAG